MFKSNSTDPFILIDAGHGGLKQNGTYATYPYKRHAFADTLFNEGVLNRALANLISFKLDFHGIKICLVANGSHDFSLDARTDFANDIHINFDRCFYLSIHHNFFKDERPKGVFFNSF